MYAILLLVRTISHRSPNGMTFDWINSIVTWVIAEREIHPMQTEMLRSWIPLKVDTPISSTQIRESGYLDMIDSRIKEEVNTLLNKKGKAL